MHQKKTNQHICFQEDIRPKLKAKFPDDSLGQLSKRLGKLWGDLKDKDKKKYNKLAEKDKLRYEKDLNTYKTGGEIEKGDSEDNYYSDEVENSSISPDDSYIIHGNSSNSNSNSNSNSDSYSDDDS